MKFTYYDKENGMIEMNHEGHKYLVNITYGKVEAYKDNKPMKRLGKVVQYMLERYKETF